MTGPQWAGQRWRCAVSVFAGRSQTMVDPDRALPGRAEAMVVAGPHRVLGTSMVPPFPDGSEQAIFGMGCFWGAERTFWQLPGVHTTAVGYAGGFTPNPTYEEVCSGRTGHAEVVLVVFDPHQTSYATMLRAFFEHHDPTQVMRQGNDVGSQYRSMVLTADDQQQALAEATRDAFGQALRAAGHGPVATEITRAGTFFYAEPYHQQYLAANPNGYCGLGGTGVVCPVGLDVSAPSRR